MNRKTIAIIGGVFAVVAVLGVALFVRAQKARQAQEEQMQSAKNAAEAEKQAINPTVQSEIESVKDLIDGEYTFTPIDTTGWQTYRNEEAGFEVKIPKNWSGKREQNGSICLQEEGKEYIVEETRTCPIRISFADRKELQPPKFHDLLSHRIKSPENKVWHMIINNQDAIVSYGFGNLATYAFEGNRYWSITSEPDGTFKSGVNYYPSGLTKIYPMILQTLKFLK